MFDSKLDAKSIYHLLCICQQRQWRYIIPMCDGSKDIKIKVLCAVFPELMFRC